MTTKMINFNFKKLVIITAVLFGYSFVQAQMPKIQYFRPYDQRSVNMFETSKQDTVKYSGLKVRIGGNFTQQYQSLDHENQLFIDIATGEPANQLVDLGGGFNLATANLNIDVQLQDGIQLNIITYLSSRHHPEAWVKGGYLQIDKLPIFKSELLDNMMEFVTIKIGHMEINYGDAHFRRTDNANAMANPFVGNYIMDAFTTEIGAEVYYKNPNGFLAMVGLTNGEIKGAVTNPDRRSPSFYGKLGIDRNLTDELRFRLTGSLYTTGKSANNTLFGGDRSGSRYYNVMDIEGGSSSFTSGRFNPGFNYKNTSWVINPFIKFHGLEFFGNFERANGRRAAEIEERTWEQIGFEGLYRFFQNEDVYLGLRYDKIEGEMIGILTEASIDRIQVAAGWFIKKNILLKAEYVKQEYNDFAPGTAFHEGQFDGFLVEAAVGF